MSRKKTKHGEQTSQSECVKDQFLLCVVTARNQQVLLYQIKGFYVEFLANVPAQKGRAAKKMPRQPYHIKKTPTPAHCRQVIINLDQMALQRFSIYLN